MNGLNLSFSTKTWVKVCGYSSFDWGVPLPEKLGLFGWMCGVFWRNSLGCGRVVWSGQAWHKFGFQPGSILSWDDRRQEVDFRHKSRFADKSPSQGFIWPIQQTASISTTGPGASTWCFGGVANVFNLGVLSLSQSSRLRQNTLDSLWVSAYIIWFSVSAHVIYIISFLTFFHPLQTAKKPWLTPMTPMTTGCQLRFLLAAICLICYCAPTYRKAFRRLGTAPGSTLCWVFIGNMIYIYIILLYIYNSDSIFSFSLFYRNKGLYRQIIDVNTEKSVRNSSHNSQMVNYPKGETPTNSSDLPSLLLGFEMI